jgi:hypothetical protein
MSQLTITLSDKADALIAQLQKEIFNRRRKKVSAAGVIETLVESGAKSQSDKRFATSWSNLVADIEKAARVAHANGAKPANLSDEEWALVLSHRTRAVTTTTAKGRSGRAQAKGPKPRVSTRAKGDSAAAIDPAEANAAAQEPKAPKAAVKRTAKAKPAAKASRTTLKSTPAPTEDAKAVTKPRTTRAKATQAGAKPAPKSAGRRSSPASSSRAGRRTSATPAASAAADNAAIPSAAAATTRSRRKVSSTPTKATRTSSARASAATRMAKAANRLGAITSPSPVAEPAPTDLAIGSNDSGPAAEAESL